MILKPTITYPSGGEIIHDSKLTITWNDYNLNRNYEYEIFFTDDYSDNCNWIQIATVSGLKDLYEWNIPNYIRSNNIRLSIRIKLPNGEKSEYSIIGSNFSVKKQNLSLPSFISPISGNSYDKYIEIIPDYFSINGTYSQRSYLQFFYSSKKLNIDLTSFAQDVPIYTKNIIWNTINLLPSDDYILHIFLSDYDGNTSDMLQITNIHISHSGYFIIDTTPPVSSIEINNGDNFTKNREINIKILSFDETTGVHSMQIIEGSNISKPEPIANVKSFILSENDGTKSIELLLQDYGANRNNDNIYRLFDKFLFDNTIIDMTYLNDGSLWCILKDENSLYKINEYPSKILSLNNEPTCIVSFNNQIYISTVDNNYGTLNKYTGAYSLEIIYGFDDENSYITCMESYNAKLYIGMKNGKVYAYNGATISLVGQFLNPILSIKSDNGSLYLTLKNNDKIYALINNDFVEVI